VTGEETYRAVIEARRPTDTGGGACTLTVRRVDGRVQLLHHGVLSTGAVLSDEQAHELAGYLVSATRREPS
jgi:allophanate hydrolase subunit 2